MMNTEVFELSPLNPWMANAPFLWLLVWFFVWFGAWFWGSRNSRARIDSPRLDPNPNLRSSSSANAGSGSKSHPLSRPPPKATALVLLGLTGGLVATAAHGYAITHARIEIDDQEIRFIAHSIYSIPRSDLVLGKAIEIDLDQRPAFSPAVDLDGFYVPGFRSGWYRLENGIRAFTLLTHKKNGIVIPTRDNYAIFVSPDDPQALMNALRDSDKATAK